MSYLRSLCLGSFALALGCGARTTISVQESTESGGTGGQASGGGGGSSTGGTGGTPIDACAGFAFDGPPITSLVARGGGVVQSGVALVAPDERSVMSFVTRRSAFNLDGEVLATTFDAWEAWPTTQGPLRFIVPSVRGAGRATPGFGSDVILAFPSSVDADEDLALPAVALAVSPDTDYVEAPTTRLFAFGLAPVSVSFITRSATRAHLGVVQEADNGFFLARAELDRNGNILEGPSTEVGCGDRPTKSASLAVAGGFLTATSSGAPHGDCLDAGPLLPPTRLQVDLSSDGRPRLTNELVSSEPFADVQMVASSDGGAWVISRTDGSTSLTYPPIAAERYTSEGVSFAEVTLVVADGQTNGPFASAPFGDGFAIAWLGGVDAETPIIVVEIFDGDAMRRASASVDAGFSAVTELSLVASPRSDALVVGWTSGGPDGIMKVARVACQP